MAHGRGGFRGSFPRGKRRQTDWIGSADQGLVAVASGASQIVQSFAMDGSDLGADATVVRTRGLLVVKPQTGAADINIIGALGICIVTDQAFAAGAASILGPWTNKEWDGWFVWVPFALSLDVTTDVGRLLISRQYEIDSKAMRKFDAGNTIVVLVESQAGALEAGPIFRMLMKLP